MTNLTEKFDEVQAQLATEHTQLLAALAAQVDRITDTAENQTNLRILSTTLNGIAVSNVQNRDHLLAIRDNTTFAAQLAAQTLTAVGVTNSYLSQLLTKFDTFLDRLGEPPAGPDFTLVALLQFIAARTGGTWESLGVLASPAPGTALDLLACICDSTRSGVRPGPGDPGRPACTIEYTSNEMVLIPIGVVGIAQNIIAARFPSPPPAPITFGTIFGVGRDEMSLNNTDWTGWHVFVESDEDQYAEGPFELTRFPTHEWRALSGSNEKSFSVSERGTITVTLCYAPPTALNPGECLLTMADNERGNKQAYTLPEGLGPDYTISTTSPYYMYEADGTYAGGPFAAGLVKTLGDITQFGGTILEFGAQVSEPPVEIQICRPAEEV